MEEDRKFSQGKERNSNNSELHLGEERHNSNKRNWHKKKGKGDLRDKLNKKRDRDDRGNYDSSKMNDKNKKAFPCHSCSQIGHFRSECRKKKKYNNDKKKQDNHDDPKGSPSEEVCIMLMFALKLYLLLFFQIAGLSTPVVHHISQETVNVLLPCKQFQGEIDMST